MVSSYDVDADENDDDATAAGGGGGDGDGSWRGRCSVIDARSDVCLSGGYGEHQRTLIAGPRNMVARVGASRTCLDLQD